MQCNSRQQLNNYKVTIMVAKRNKVGAPVGNRNAAGAHVGLGRLFTKHGESTARVGGGLIATAISPAAGIALASSGIKNDGARRGLLAAGAMGSLLTGRPISGARLGYAAVAGLDPRKLARASYKLFKKVK